MTSFTKMLNYFLSPKLFTQQVLVKIFFVILVLVGLFSYQDYGYTRDEAINRWRGIVTAHYMGELWNIDYLKNVDPLKVEARNQFSQLSPTEAEHGALFETISAVLEKVVLGNSAVDERSIYFLRHLLIYLVFIGGAYAVFCMARRRFLDWRVGLLAAGLLVLSPRIYGNAFFNSNDIVFLATLALAANGAIELIVRPNWRASLVAGLWAGIAIATRNLAILIPLAVAMIFIISAFKEIASQKLFPTKHFFWLMAYLSVSLIATIVCWPWLWEDPFGRLAQSFAVMSRIPFEMHVLYFGQLISTFDIPWHYAPVWIGITTPLIYLALFGIGVGAILRQLWICKWRIYSNKSQLQDLFFLGLFAAPLLAVMLLHSSLYDGWRHLFFIYPFLVLVAVRGWMVVWVSIKQYRAAKIGVSAILIFALAFNGLWMIRSHPFESFYFNSLAGKNWKSQFDVDYWSLSVRQALEYIVRHDSSAYVRVGSVSVMTDLGGLRVMDPSERARVLGVSSGLTADYMIQIYREDSRDLAKIDSNYRIFHEIKIGNEVALSIYQNQNHRSLPGVNLNERVDFSNSGKGIHYLLGVGIADRIGSSWHHPEPWGVWAATEQVSIAIPRAGKDPKTLHLELIGSPQEDDKGQKIEIDVGGQFAQTVMLVSQKPTFVSIPLKPIQLKSNYVQIEFKVVEPVKSPNNDSLKNERWLGVGLISAKYE